MNRRWSLLLALGMVWMFLAPALAAEEVKLPIYEQKQTFAAMVRKEDLCQNTWAEKECVQFTEAQTNIHMDWIEVPNSGWEEKVNLTFASGDLPDLIIGGVDVVANMDTLVALDALVDENAPNVLSMFATLTDMRGALTLSDGHVYSLPIGDADVKNLINNEFWINAAWMEKLGLAMPTTLDEFVEVLKAFRDKDPNGNGIQDEIPLLVSASSGAAKLSNLFGFFGTVESDHHVRVEDGQVLFTPQEDAYFEALQWIHTLYAQGLMNREYFTEDYQQFLAKGNSETCVTGVALEWYIDNIIFSGHVQDFTYMPLFDGPNGKTLWSKNNTPNSPQGTLNGFVITTACKDPAALVKWYDYINSGLDILNLWNYGPEGVIWRYTDDGRWEVFTDNVPEGSSSSQVRRTLGTGPRAPLYAYSRFRGADVEVFAPRIAAKVEANEAYMPFTPAENIPNGFGDAEEETERNMILVNIDHYLDQFRAKAIVDGITSEQWQSHLKTLKTLAVDEYVAYWQNYYDQHR